MQLFFVTYDVSGWRSAPELSKYNISKIGMQIKLKTKIF